jgi:putative peptidoglycan lipid II flippase
MGRRGDLFDQDEPEPPATGGWGPPVHAGRGVLFDQDASIELPRIDPMQAARYQRELDRRREREIELRREGRSSVRITPPGGRPARTSPSPEPDSPSAPRPRPPATSPAVRISSRAAPVYLAGPSTGGAEPSAPGTAGAPPSTGRATAILAFGTFASRLTGFLRVLVIGYVLGVGVLSDAFNYANGAPNIVYDLLLGGILSATLVPVFVEQLSGDDPAEASRSISAVFTAIAAALVVMSGLLYLAAPLVIHFYLLLTPHSTGAAERALATRLLRDFSPQVFFLGATVASTALLNARRRFTAAAVSPVVNNVVAIAALLATKTAADHVLHQKGLSGASTLQQFSRDGRAVLILGLGTTLGYAVQLLIQLPAMRRLGLRMRPVWEPRHPAVRRVAGLSTWLVGVVLTNQASLALVMILAGRTAGGVTAYQFSYQFFQLPYALIAVSVASAIMPDLSEHWSTGRYTRFEGQFVTGLRVTLAALTPIAVVYVVVAKPFVELAIHHGAVSPNGAHLVGRTLAYFVAGLPGFSAFFLLMRAFQAMQDARSMFRIYVIENVITVIAALLLSPSLGVPGLAVAWVAPYTVASIYAVVLLRRRSEIGPLGGALTVRALIRIVVASLLAGGAAVLVGLPLRTAHGDALVLARLVLQVAVAGGVYLYLATLLRMRELRPILRMFGRR